MSEFVYLIEFGFEFFILSSTLLICIRIPHFCNRIPNASIGLWALVLVKCLSLLSRVINLNLSSLNSRSNGAFNSFIVFISFRFVSINIYKYTIHNHLARSLFIIARSPFTLSLLYTINKKFPIDSNPYSPI